MSSEAVFEVTKAIRKLLHSQLVKSSAGAKVTLLPPGEDLPAVSGVNLFLYRVAESPFTKNQPWRGDRSTHASNRPALGLDLHYLITPLGAKPSDDNFLDGDDAHKMLGAAMLTLHEHAILNDVHLPEFDADLELPAFLLDSYEQVKITLAPTGVEELSKIWATINKPYRLSAAYEVTLVELTPTVPPPVGGGIVTTPQVNVITLDPPRLVSITPPSGALARLQQGAIVPNDVRIDGFGFTFPGQTAVVTIGGQVAPIQSQPAPTANAMTVLLPDNLDAGPDVDVRMTLNGRTSAPLNFTITPWLSRIQPVRTALDPAVPSDQTLTLSGRGFTPAPIDVRFDEHATRIATRDAATPRTKATAPIPNGLANGVYLVRIGIDDPDQSLSNTRELEVVPLLSGAAVAAATAARLDGGMTNVHELTVNGARLNGDDIRVIVDGAPYPKGAIPVANATSFTAKLGRLLSPGPHTLAVNVDGHLSRSIEFTAPP
jgi:hypothetical protein